ncbi:hypothetical protein Q31b_04690 [Novipirellula aureliae]|uniref:Gamma-butyrobetaine hydroxylase-like N-terminal domain-containing protein n=1 Tax=Novipirellula aureliae TaxID=2527966 RepID=A0A5C6E8Z1_9BACT|nr:DUF971 domain-containing protein [Novipirellula aureliae]TWU45298.1 hypothetical protein Q31b_04690 [Novipirellula aureliae]
MMEIFLAANDSETPFDDFQLSPVSITRDGDVAIQIHWSDGSINRWTAAELRKACPCATCREKRNAIEQDKRSSKPVSLPVLSAQEARPLRIESMSPVGSYAYNIAFSDGHSSGLYPMRLLAGKTIEME